MANYLVVIDNSNHKNLKLCTLVVEEGDEGGGEFTNGEFFVICGKSMYQYLNFSSYLLTADDGALGMSDISPTGSPRVSLDMQLQANESDGSL